MPTKTGTRRRQLRYDIQGDRKTCVEFELDGRPHRLPLTNLSSTGISFAADEIEELPSLEEGADLHDVTIRVGECLMRGDLVLMHVTERSGAGVTCGALFYPESDTDLVKLKSVLAGMDAVGND